MEKNIIPFNKTSVFGNELNILNECINNNITTLNDNILQKNKTFFNTTYGFNKESMFFTHTCSHALEMIALACDIDENDEVIVPSFTFVTSASAFALRGAKLVFIDSNISNPNMDCDKIEELITKKTKVIVCVHYAGIPCDIDKLLNICEKYNIILVEDSAQSINSFYKNKPLGTFGSFSTFSFHETKNIQCGEGGLLLVNDKNFINKIKLIYEKGTNRIDLKNGLVDKYSWYELGSSFAMSGITASYLYSQLLNLSLIISKREEIWNTYYKLLNNEIIKDKFILQEQKNHNFHMFYIIGKLDNYVEDIIKILKDNKIMACRHYVTLHDSPYIKKKFIYNNSFENSKNYQKNLIRLPLYHDLNNSDIQIICKLIIDYCITL
jgi:dTDP-4-amino-4,6-dideoxygalactose transaminase